MIFSRNFSLRDRLEGMMSLAAGVEESVSKFPESRRTGFIPYPLREQRDLVLKMQTLLPEGANVLELGCGIGSFTSLSAVAGFRAGGIDCNSYLIEVARHLSCMGKEIGFLEEHTEGTFAVGNIHQGSFYEAYVRFAGEVLEHRTWKEERHLPLDESLHDPYRAVGMTLEQADLIYGYFWPQHLPFLCSFLSQTTRRDALFVLPFYHFGDHHALLPLVPAAQTKHETIYRRE